MGVEYLNPEGQVEIGLGWLPFRPGLFLIFAVLVTPLVKLKTNTETSPTLVEKISQISLDASF